MYLQLLQNIYDKSTCSYLYALYKSDDQSSTIISYYKNLETAKRDACKYIMDINYFIHCYENNLLKYITNYLISLEDKTIDEMYDMVYNEIKSNIMINGHSQNGLVEFLYIKKIDIIMD